MPVTLDRDPGRTGQRRRKAVAQRFPAELAAVPASRRFVRHQVTSSDLCDDAMLLTSELAANAVEHARTPFDVTVVTGQRSLRIEVADDSRRTPTVLSVPADAQRGRGLQIVRQIADRWGVDIRGSGKAVWFELGTDDPDLGSAGRQTDAAPGPEADAARQGDPPP